MESGESEDVPLSAIPLLKMMHGESEDYLLILDALRHLCVVGYKSFANTYVFDQRSK